MYEPALQPNGNALVYLQASNCDGSGNGSLDVGGPIAPMRSGSVVEMSNRGYSWSEFFPCMTPPGSAWGECWMFPDPAPKVPVGFMEAPFPLGVNILGYVNRSTGTEAEKDMGCHRDVAGQGLVQLQLDPKSELGRLGIFQDGQVGYIWDSTATCHLVMSQT